MDAKKLEEMLSGASASTRQLNPSLVAGVLAAEPEPRPVPALARSQADEGCRPRRRHIRITARRTRLCDPDNQVVKFIIDALRYNGIIADDTTYDITLEVGQEKVSQKIKEGTLIEVI